MSNGKGNTAEQKSRRYQRMKRRRDGLEGTPEQQAAAKEWFSKRQARKHASRRRKREALGPIRLYIRHPAVKRPPHVKPPFHRMEAIAGRPRPEICEVCGSPSQDSKAIHFDHCHTTGEFRGWLCVRCNHTLGKVKDNPELLRRLADYLENPIGPTPTPHTIARREPTLPV